jgi:hypothetical protein
VGTGEDPKVCGLREFGYWTYVISAGYIERLSPYGINILTQMVHQKLSHLVAAPDHDLRRIIGHALVLKVSLVEGKRRSQSMTREVVSPTWVPILRKTNHN